MRSPRAALFVALASVLAGSRGAAAEPPGGAADDAAGFGAPADAMPSDLGAPGGSEDDAAGFGELEPEPSAETSADAATPIEGARERPTIGGILRGDGAIWSRRFGENAFAQARVGLDAFLRYRHRRFRLELGGHGEIDLAYRHRRDGYDPATLDEYEWLVRPRESSVAFDGARFGASVGYQIEAWGEGELLTVVDVPNPRDLREPGLTDLLDLRIPVLSTRLVYAQGAFRVAAFVVHEAHYGYRPPPFGTWSTLREPVLERSALGGTPIADDLATRGVFYDDAPARYSAEAQQIFARLTYAGSEAEVSLHYASLLDAVGVASLPPLGVILGPDPFGIPLDHRRYHMVALSGVIPAASFLVRWELALDVDRPVNVVDLDAVALEVERRSLLRWMLGIRYAGFDHAAIVIEYADGTEEDAIASRQPSDRTLLLPIGMPTLTGRYTQSFARDRLVLDAAIASSGERLRGGLFARAQLTYEARDALHVALGYALYHPFEEPSPVQGFDRHDRLYLRIRWDFLVLS